MIHLVSFQSTYWTRIRRSKTAPHPAPLLFAPFETSFLPSFRPASINAWVEIINLANVATPPLSSSLPIFAQKLLSQPGMSNEKNTRIKVILRLNVEGINMDNQMHTITLHKCHSQDFLLILWLENTIHILTKYRPKTYLATNIEHLIRWPPSQQASPAAFHLTASWPRFSSHKISWPWFTGSYRVQQTWINMAVIPASVPVSCTFRFAAASGKLSSLNRNDFRQMRRILSCLLLGIFELGL